MEPLEARRLLAVNIAEIRVNATNIGQALGAGDVTLEDAVALVHSPTLYDSLSAKEKRQVTLSDTVTVPRIVLQEKEEYQRDVPISLEVPVAIDGNGSTLLQGIFGFDRHFEIFGDADVLITDLTLSGGITIQRSEDSSGGSILNQGTLTLDNVRLSNNRATLGGAIHNTQSGKLTIKNSLLDGNTASSFFLNVATKPTGGALSNLGEAIIINSTITGNLASGSSLNPGLSRNNTGGIDNSGNLTVINSTIALNRGPDLGVGGIHSNGSNSSIKLYNTLLVKNTIDTPDNKIVDVLGFFDGASANNLISQPDSAPSAFFNGKNNILAVVTPFNPNFMLDSNLKMTPAGTGYLPLKRDSIAIDAGSNEFLTTPGGDGIPGNGDEGEQPVLTDQRNVFRKFGASVDIGAAEFYPEELIVDSINDGVDGNLGEGQFTLREALHVLSNVSETKSIKIIAEGTLKLNEGSLTLTRAAETDGAVIKVRGPGADKFIIDAEEKSQVLSSRVTPAEEGAIAKLVVGGVSLKNGIFQSANSVAGALTHVGDLSLEQVKVSGSTADFGAAVAVGGDISIIESEIFDNQSGDGAVYVVNGSVTVTGSAFYNNVSTRFDGAAAIYMLPSLDGQSLSVVNSTFANNQGSDERSSVIKVSASSGINQSDSRSTFAIEASTSINNSSTRLFNIPRVNVKNSLFSANQDNSIKNGENGNAVVANDTLIFGNFGGPTRTFSINPIAEPIPRVTSASAPKTDQRGFARGSSFTPGAFEPTSTILVTTNVDEFDGSANAELGSGTSLREALALSQQTDFPTTIRFSKDVSGTIFLPLGELPITNANMVTIVGPGANALAIDGLNNNRIFHLQENAAATISGLTLQNGRAVGFQGGGAIRNLGNLHLSAVEVKQNTADEAAGGIANLGTATLDRVSVHNNSSAGSGGGIGNGGTLTILNSTIALNEAIVGFGFGGGIDSVGQVTIVNSTIAGNKARFGGGIVNDEFEEGASLKLINTVVVGNQTESDMAKDIGGKAVESGSKNNLIGNADSAGGLLQGVDGNIVGKPLAEVLFSENGVPMLTRPADLSVIELMPGSPAVDSGSSALATRTGVQGGPPLSIDQAGVQRLIGSSVDMGAYEFGLRLSGPAKTNSATPELTIVAEPRWFVDGTKVQVDVDLNQDGSFAGNDELAVKSIDLVGGKGTITLPALPNGLNRARARIVAVPDGIVWSSPVLEIQVDSELSRNTFTASPSTIASVLTLKQAGDEVVLSPGVYQGLTINSDVTLSGTTDGIAVIQGASPALNVLAGDVQIGDGIILTNDTDSPTVVVGKGASLTMRNSVILESTVGNQPAFLVEEDGQLDLGNSVQGGNNSIGIRGSGKLIESRSAVAVSALGNIVEIDGAPIQDLFLIENLTHHALDDPSLGLVSWVTGQVYVTPQSGSINNAIAAVATGGTVNIQSGVYNGNIDATAKSVTLSPGGEGVAKVVLTGGIKLNGNSTLRFNINGASEAAYDRWLVNSTVELGASNDFASAIIDLGYTPAFEDNFLLVETDGGGPILGMFVDRPENSVKQEALADLRTTYLGSSGDGNDFVLTVPQLDFGDLPEPYPVTREANGARHQISELFLGSAIDSEADGQLDDQAGQDGSGGDDNNGSPNDEDGVFVVSSIVAAANASTQSSFLVVSSGSGFLNAWIDFDQNGSWQAGEQIFLDVPVVEGENLLSFTVPAGAKPGFTGARFRLSTETGLQPTGVASDGEVEDYIAELLNGDAVDGAAVAIDLPSSGAVQVTREGDVLAVSRNATRLFSAPEASLQSLFLAGTSGDDTVNLASIEAVLSGLVSFDGFGGNDSLRLTGSNQVLDLTSLPANALANFETIDISGSGNNSLKVDVSSLPGQTLEIISNQGDTVDIGAGWAFDKTEVANERFVRVYTQNSTIRLIGPADWQNAANPLDVDENGLVEPLDALLIINELNNPRFSNDNQLAAANGIVPFPNTFLDVSGNDLVEPMDALLIINFLNRNGGDGEPEVATWLPRPASADRERDEETTWERFDRYFMDLE